MLRVAKVPGLPQPKEAEGIQRMKGEIVGVGAKTFGNEGGNAACKAAGTSPPVGRCHLTKATLTQGGGRTVECGPPKK